MLSRVVPGVPGAPHGMTMTVTGALQGGLLPPRRVLHATPMRLRLVFMASKVRETLATMMFLLTVLVWWPQPALSSPPLGHQPPTQDKPLPCTSSRLPTACPLPAVLQEGSAEGAHPGPPPSYADALQAREFELWQRQSRLYDQLLEQQERDRQHWEDERQRWAQQEASLKQEVAELRAQLLYVLSNAQARTGGPGAATSSSGSSGTVYAPPPPLPGRSAAQLPLATAGERPGARALRAAQQVQG